MRAWADMPDINVKGYIDRLREALPYVPPIPVQEIKALHKTGDLGGVVKLIRNTMNVGVGLTIHWTGGPPPKEIPGALAWINLPGKMPYYGTAAFKDLKLDIFIMKSFAQTKPYDQFAMAVAHELSHVVLESIEHPLRKEEKAVDLTAMILGFSYLYRSAAHTIQRVGYNQFQQNHLGYLSEREIDAAAKILVPSRLRAKHGMLKFAWENSRLLVYLGIIATIWGGTFMSSRWNAHNTDHQNPVGNIVRNPESICIERLRLNRSGATSQQAETFCNCYLEEIGNPPTRLQEQIDLVKRRCSHEAFGE
jgi:hypothetical protein